MTPTVRQISRKIRKFRYDIPAEDARMPEGYNTYGNGLEIVVTEVDGKTRQDTAGIEIFIISKNPGNTIDLGVDGRQNLSNLKLPAIYKAKVYPVIGDLESSEDETISEHVENIPVILRAMADKIEELIAEQSAKNQAQQSGGEQTQSA